jgi:serine/threonine protein kinase
VLSSSLSRGHTQLSLPPAPPLHPYPRLYCLCPPFLQSDSHLYMVLDLARRGDLRHSLRASPNGRFSEKTAMHIFRQLLEALHCCHVQSILHRG